MIQITPQMRVLVAIEPVDFRRGVDGLAQQCRAALAEDPFSGAVFVFSVPLRPQRPSFDSSSRSSPSTAPVRSQARQHVTDRTDTFPLLEGRLIKHHLFPQEAILARWFKANGINIHEWTMLIPVQVHLRIHRGARGGLWNEAWRQYYEATNHRSVTREELLRKAFELALRYDIAGPIHAYRSPIPPPGPQLLDP